MKKRNIIFTVLAVLVIGGLIHFFSIPNDRFEGGGTVTHTYTISDSKSLVVDELDCGATCDYHTYVYLADTTNGKAKNKTLLSCEGISDIELKEVTDSSATISAMLPGEDDRCTYKIGDHLQY